jgi:hypothetical protein
VREVRAVEKGMELIAGEDGWAAAGSEPEGVRVGWPVIRERNWWEGRVLQ